MVAWDADDLDRDLSNLCKSIIEEEIGVRAVVQYRPTDRNSPNTDSRPTVMRDAYLF